MELPKKSRCEQYKDGNGNHFVVPEDLGSPRVDVWWNRGPRRRVRRKPTAKMHTAQSEELVIRQENGRVGADVLVITPGQAYDLIDALCRAVENP